MKLSRLNVLALALAVGLASPAFAERVQIDPGANTVQCSNCATGGATGATSSDASGTITAGGTYQTVLGANVARKGCLIQNPVTASEALSIKVGTMASPFTLPAGGTFSCAGGPVVVTDAITVTAATTGHAFAAVSQ